MQEIFGWTKDRINAKNQLNKLFLLMFWTLWKDLKRFQNQSRKGQGIEKLKKDLLSHCMQMPKVILNLGLNLEFVYIDDILDVVTALWMWETLR